MYVANFVYRINGLIEDYWRGGEGHVVEAFFAVVDIRRHSVV